jgi:hypothetical protein
MPCISKITNFTFNNRTDHNNNPVLVLQVTKQVKIFDELDSTGLDYLPSVSRTVTKDATSEDLLELAKNNFKYP